MLVSGLAGSLQSVNKNIEVKSGEGKNRVMFKADILHEIHGMKGTEILT